MASSSCTEHCHFRGIQERTLNSHCNTFDTFDMNLIFFFLYLVAWIKLKGMFSWYTGELILR